MLLKACKCKTQSCVAVRRLISTSLEQSGGYAGGIVTKSQNPYNKSHYRGTTRLTEIRAVCSHLSPRPVSPRALSSTCTAGITRSTNNLYLERPIGKSCLHCHTIATGITIIFVIMELITQPSLGSQRGKQLTINCVLCPILQPQRSVQVIGPT